MTDNFPPTGNSYGYYDDAPQNIAAKRQRKAALRAYAERQKELVEALEKAERGLDVIINHYASVAFTGSRVAADEQYPWIAAAMKAQNAARATLSKHKAPA